MKTLRFGRLNVKQIGGGEVVLVAASPGQGKVEVQLTPDELMIFMTEVSNELAVSRDVELRLRIQKDLEYEQKRKGQKTNEKRSTTGEDD